MHVTVRTSPLDVETLVWYQFRGSKPLELNTMEPILVGMRLHLLTSIVAAGLLLSACSSSSTIGRSLGDCKKVGTFKKVDGNLFVCSGETGKTQYYADGPDFNAMVFSGRVLAYEIVEFNQLSLGDPIELRLRALKVPYEEAISKIMKPDIIDQISIYSAGSARWDGLIAAFTRYQSAVLLADQATAEMLAVLKTSSKANGGRENTSSEMKSAMDYILSFREKEEISLAKLRPEITKLRSHLIGKFGIRATSKLVEFAINYYAQPSV